MPTPVRIADSMVDRVPVDSRRRRVLDWLIGPRFIDLPIRALACIDLATRFSPDSRESSEPLYLLFHFASGVLTVVAAFTPLLAGLIAGVLFFVYATTFPEFIDPFQTNIEFSAAVLLTQLRWVPSLLLTALAFLQTWLCSYWGFSDALASPFPLLWSSWVTNSLLALVAAAVETRFRKFTAFREQAAREREREKHAHERELERERVAFAVDAHDTVSHGLAQQGQMIKMLAAPGNTPEMRELLSHLALANDETQQRLRVYLAGLKGAEQQEASAPQISTALALLDLESSLQRAAEVGGIQLQIDISGIAEAVEPENLDAITQVLRELVTNMVKHADPAHACYLQASMEGDSGELLLESRNMPREYTDAFPRSLTLRATGLGGNCVARVSASQYRVVVRLPVREIHGIT